MCDSLPPWLLNFKECPKSKPTCLLINRASSWGIRMSRDKQKSKIVFCDSLVVKGKFIDYQFSPRASGNWVTYLAGPKCMFIVVSPNQNSAQSPWRPSLIEGVLYGDRVHALCCCQSKWFFMSLSHTGGIPRSSKKLLWSKLSSNRGYTIWTNCYGDSLLICCYLLLPDILGGFWINCVYESGAKLTDRGKYGECVPVNLGKPYNVIKIIIIAVIIT